MEVDMTIKMGPKSYPSIKALEEGKSINEQEIRNLCLYVDERYDCADFRMTTIIRTMYEYKEYLSEAILEKMKESILNFKYWMDEPGDDSMCYWSENHQILFASVEYLAGQLYPDEIFTNNGMTGLEHLDKARDRILRWLKYRWNYGFTEWHSNVYYEEDIPPLTLLIDFCKDEDIFLKSKMILDILLLDIAMHSYKGLFSATSGRCYENQKKFPLRQDTLDITEYIWQYDNIDQLDYSRISSNFILMKNYKVPKVIQLIGRDENEVVIKDSMGLDLKEIKHEFSDKKDLDTTGMFLWTMESFTNTESVNMALEVFNQWELYENNFLRDFKMLNIWIVRKLGLLPLVIKVLNPVTQGIAIQRANTYTYKTKDFMLSTAQKHHPGEFSDQQHIWQATLSNQVTVFTTHPGNPAFDNIDRNFSPDYWVGNGIFPHSAQDKNVHISIYDIRGRKGFMERERQQYTHAYFPQDKFDKVILEEQYLFGQLGDVYITLIGKNKLKINEKDSSDIIQEGAVTYWICEIGTKDRDNSFEYFINKIKDAEITFDKGMLIYYGSSKYALNYKGSFSVDDNIMNVNYERFDTPYVKALRKPKELYIEFAGKSLYLNFDKLERKEEDNERGIL